MIRATHQLSLLLFVLSALVYLLLFSGLPISTDEVSLFSGAQSLSQRGLLSATPLYWNENGTVLFGAPGHAYPTFEPTQMIAAAPLHWLGRHLPGVGLVPVVWLFNVLVTAATVPLLFRSSLRLGYKLATSLLLAQLFAFATIALPYSRSFFREPLTTFFLLLALFALLGKDQQQARWNALLFGAGVGVDSATKVSKVAAVLPLFLLAIVVLASLPWQRRLQWILWSVAGFCLFASPLWWSVFLQDSGQAESVAARSAASTLPLSALPLTTAGEWQQLWRGVSGLLLSPGKSIFFYSPILLLSLVGLPWFLRRHLAVGVAILGVCGVYTVGYGLSKGEIWFGGLNWGPRFLVPITPFLLMAALPVLEKAFHAEAGKRALSRLAIGLLIGLSLTVQLLSTLVPLTRYSEAVTQIAPDAMWTKAIYEWRFTPFFFYWHLIEPQQIDWLWLRQLRTTGAIDLLSPIVGLVAIVLTASVGYRVYRSAQSQPGNANGLRFYGILALPLLLSATLLYNSVHDPRFPGGEDRLALAEALNQQTQAGDAILLSDANQLLFYLNTLRSATPLYAINPATKTLPAKTSELFHALHNDFQRVWLISHDNFEGLPLPRRESRPDEAWWLSASGRLSEQTFSPYARVSAFVAAPDELVQQPMDILFGEEILLKEVRHPHDSAQDSTQNSAQRNQTWLVFDLLWQAVRPPTHDYTLFFQILNQDGQVVWQQDQQPHRGFLPFTSWQINAPVFDKIVVPIEGLPKGRLQIIAGLYFFDQNGYPQRLTTTVQQDFVVIMNSLEIK